MKASKTIAEKVRREKFLVLKFKSFRSTTFSPWQVKSSLIVGPIHSRGLKSCPQLVLKCEILTLENFFHCI